ncbi:hypothetical protein [Bacillus toyonensis]|uniref:hypothetical protein n=1 Tax=Bacillus toyonensis TaxID=155322 RepID=UPI00031C9FAB|nr:hypothetical protein [Bacillus toyonensis]
MESDFSFVCIKETIYEEGKESTPKSVKEYDYDGFGNRKNVKETVAGKIVKM